MSIDQHRGGRTRQHVLITGGRAPVALELARLFSKAGHRVSVAESAEYHLCRVSSAVEASFLVPSPRHHPQAYVQRLAELIAELDIDCLIPTCEEIFYIAAGLERLTGCRVLASSREMLARLHHKRDFIDWLGMLGFTAPATTLISSATEWRQVTESAAGRGEAMVYKPAFSRFASKVRLPGGNASKHRRSDPPASQAPLGISPESPWVAQQYIPGKAVCTYSIVHKGALVAHAAYDSRYRTGQTGASVYFEHMEHSAALEWVRKFAAASDFSGQIGFDFIEAADGTLYPIECNPRATSGIHLFTLADGLAEALLNPARLVQAGEVVVPRSGHKAMLALPMLGCGLKPGAGGWKIWWQALREAGDVIYRKDDTRPFREQFRVVYAAYRTARKHHISLTEALTEDIEWNGEA